WRSHGKAAQLWATCGAVTAKWRNCAGRVALGRARADGGAAGARRAGSAQVWGLEAHAVGGCVVGLLLRRPFGGDAAQVAGDLPFDALLVPAELLPHESRGDGRGRDPPIPGLDRDAC